MTYQTLLFEIRDRIAFVTVNRPDKLNALNDQVMADLGHAAERIATEDAIQGALLTGAGPKAFVAGADIGDLAKQGPFDGKARALRGQAVLRRLETCGKPVIAAVNGFALGGGCELALACDFIYASDRAKFGQPEVKLGIIPGFGGTQRLARRVGIAKAKELCMTGDTIDAAEALRIGLADAVWPHGELIAKARELAGRIAANGPLAVAEVKRLIHLGQSTTLDHAIALEQRSFGLLFGTADQREGMSAFLAKPRRAPQFKGQ
jgi:enoyl-CoA hydratase